MTPCMYPVQGWSWTATGGTYKMADHVAKVNGNVVVSLVVKDLKIER